MMAVRKVTSSIFICLLLSFIGCGESDVSEIQEIHISIISPEDGSRVDQRVIPVTGTVDDLDLIRAVLIVNGNQQVIPIVDGKFSQEVALMAGENQIEVSTGDSGTAKANVNASFPPADLTAVLLWEGSETTDVDLYVVSPDGGEASLLRQDMLTTGSGAQMAEGVVNGRKYESFILPSGKAVKGNYLIKVNYYSDGEALGQPVNASITVSVNENTPMRAMRHFGLHTIEASGVAEPEAWWIATMVFLPDGLFSIDEGVQP